MYIFSRAMEKGFFIYAWFVSSWSLLLQYSVKIKVGVGYDIHRLVVGRQLILGGVAITHDKGLDGHSDGDVLLHAISDAILGGLGLQDIGHWFPDDDDLTKGIDSKEIIKFLKKL